MSKEERAFHQLLNSADSLVLFHRLLNEANPEGQLYALYGLYLREPEAFKREAFLLKSGDGPPQRWEGMILVKKGAIRTGSGCILRQQHWKAVIAEIEKGTFDQAFNRSLKMSTRSDTVNESVRIRRARIMFN